MLLAAISTLTIVEFIVVALVVLALVYIILKLGKNLVKILFGIAINSILGFLAIFILNTVFSLGIPATNIGVIIATAIFGLPAVGTLVILILAHTVL